MGLGIQGPRMTRWLLVYGEISPYTVDLWSLVARDRRHEVTLVYRPRGEAAEFAHEGSLASKGPLHLVKIPADVRTQLRVTKSLLRSPPPDIVVGAGYQFGHTILLPALLRLTRRSLHAAYVGDGNALDPSRQRWAGLQLALDVAKREFVSNVYDSAFSLGWSNDVANWRLGLMHQARIPLYAVDFDGLDVAARDGQTAALDGLAHPRLLCVSRLVREKNLVELLKAFGTHVAAGGEGSLALVGDGPLLGMLRDMGRSLPAERFRLLGTVPHADIGAIYVRADGLVLPSLREPWGIVVTEALGLGLPVLASDRVGAALSLAHEIGQGIKLSAPSQKALAHSIGEFFAHLSRLRRDAAQAKATVRARFDMPKVAESLKRWASQMVR